MNVFADYNDAITKWRKICKTYNGRGTVKHDNLQDEIKAWQKKKYPDQKPMGHKLIKDCKIKWGSLVTSLESGIKIKEVLNDFLKYSTLKLTSQDWDAMEQLVEILGPCKTVVESICRKDADLLEAEIAFKALFEELESNGSLLALKLLASLKTEIKKRWHPRIVGLLKYLHDPEKYPPTKVSRAKKSKGKMIIYQQLIQLLIFFFFLAIFRYQQLNQLLISKFVHYLLLVSHSFEDEDDIFKMPTADELEKTACELLFDLFGEVHDETEVLETDTTQPETVTGLSFKERMKKKIAEGIQGVKSNGPPTKKSLQSELSHFENTKQRGEILTKLYMVLKNIAPTSVASEQAFSIAGNFVPSRRSRLSDESIDDLCFEKAYFDNNGY